MAQELINALEKAGVKSEMLKVVKGNTIAIRGKTEQELEELREQIRTVDSVKKYFKRPSVREAIKRKKAKHPFYLDLILKNRWVKEDGRLAPHAQNFLNRVEEAFGGGKKSDFLAGLGALRAGDAEDSRDTRAERDTYEDTK